MMLRASGKCWSLACEYLRAAGGSMRKSGRDMAVAAALLCAPPAFAVTGGTAPDARCITVKDVVIVGGAEAWADKKLCKSPGSARYDVIEVAQAVYGAASTQAAFEKASDPQLRELRGQIEALRAQVAKAGDEATVARKALLSAQGRFVAELSGKDRGYFEAIQQFRDSVADIAAAPEGLAALALYNAGDQIGALAILDKLRAANDAARQTQSNIASAAEGRRIAELALDASKKGKLTTAQVIERFEDVMRLDPGAFWDYINLNRLYRLAGKLPDAARLIDRARIIALTDRERSFALYEFGRIQDSLGNLAAANQAFAESLAIRRRIVATDPSSAKAQGDLVNTLISVGDVRMTQGDLHGADNAYTESLSFARMLVASNPSNLLSQRELSWGLGRIGNLRVGQGNLSGADLAYSESLSIARNLGAIDPENAQVQRDLSTSLNRIGNLHLKQADFAGAGLAYAESLAIARKLAAADPSNAQAQRDVFVSLAKLADLPGSGILWREVVAQLEAMDTKGILARSDRPFLDQARTNAALNPGM